MASGQIPDTSITASSYGKNPSWDREPKHARLGREHRFWAAGWNDLNAWIQVDLGSNHVVTGLQTEGDNHNQEHQYWVEQVKVQVGNTEEDLMFIEDGNCQPKVL